MTEAALRRETGLTHDHEAVVLSLIEAWNRLFWITFGDRNLHRAEHSFALQVCERESGFDGDRCPLPRMFNWPSAFEDVQDSQTSVVTACEAEGKPKLA